MINQYPQKPADVCLQCDETKENITKHGWSCAVVSGYEQPEVEREWDEHQFDDWSDDQLRKFGITEEYFEMHRRTDDFSMFFAAAEIVCDKEGHITPVPGKDVPDICPRCLGYLGDA